jgi:hypothetical protein
VQSFVALQVSREFTSLNHLCCGRCLRPLFFFSFSSAPGKERRETRTKKKMQEYERRYSRSEAALFVHSGESGRAKDIFKKKKQPPRTHTHTCAPKKKKDNGNDGPPLISSFSYFHLLSFFL